MAIEGSLHDVGLADICQLLWMGLKTGCLTMTDRSNFGYMYFKRGPGHPCVGAQPARSARRAPRP